MAVNERRRSKASFCSYNGFCMKILIVWLICILGLSFIMMLDSPGSLQHTIMTEFNLTSYHFSLLYSLSSWPNAFAWLTGFVIDRYLGVTVGSLIFILLSCLGNSLYILGVYLKKYWIMILARFFFGFGSEATSLACNAYILLWFPGKGMNVVFALVKAIPWLGSAIIFQISNRLLEFLIYKNYNERQAFFLTMAITMSIIFVCLVSVIMLSLISRPLLKKNKKIEDDMLKVQINDIWKFPSRFWILILISSLVLNSCFNFILMAQNFYREEYSLSINNADNIISVFSITACFMGPFFGSIVDRLGRNLFFITLSILTALCAHLIYLLVKIPPIIPVIILSCSLSLMLSSAMSAYTFLVKPHEVNTAFGVVQTITSGVYAAGILTAGVIISKYAYHGGEIFYCISLSVALFTCIVLWILDCKNGGTLNSTTKEREYSNNSDSHSLIRSVSEEHTSNMRYESTLPMNQFDNTKMRKSVFIISRNYDENQR